MTDKDDSRIDHLATHLDQQKQILSALPQALSALTAAIKKLDEKLEGM
jgi:hypothetical protein